MAAYIDYMARTRRYYRAQGFEKDYTWAHHTDTPFTRPGKSLSDSTVTVVTTAVTHPEVPKPIRTAEHIDFADTPVHFDTSETAWDKETTHTNDRRSYFPLEVLQDLMQAGRIGALARRYHFVPTQYSHRLTREEDAQDIARACLEDEVDIALLIPL